MLPSKKVHQRQDPESKLPDPSDLTALLQAWSRAEEGATNSLMEETYRALRRIASRQFSNEKPGHTLEPTALVHEAYLRLVRQKHTDWQNRRHFFAVAATMMRRILVDHARRRASNKRGGGLIVPMAEGIADRSVSTDDVLTLDQSLDDLARFDPRKASIIELHVFGGVSLSETAEILNCSRATITRDWRLAKAWLHRELQERRHGS